MTLTRGFWETKKVCGVSSVTEAMEHMALRSSEWPNMLAFPLPIH